MADHGDRFWGGGPIVGSLFSAALRARRTVMISRVGGLGGLVAYELAAAGVGRLVLAHGGNLKPSDLNRQLLMRHDALGQARIGTAVETLKALNPRLEIVAVPENVSETNVDELVGRPMWLWIARRCLRSATR